MFKKKWIIPEEYSEEIDKLWDKSVKSSKIKDARLMWVRIREIVDLPDGDYNLIACGSNYVAIKKRITVQARLRERIKALRDLVSAQSDLIETYKDAIDLALKIVGIADKDTDDST